MFSHIVGNEPIKSYFTHMLQHGKIGNAFLFAGAPGIGKSLFARALAKYLICGDNESQAYTFDQGNHPDFHQYYPEGKIGMHSIDTMRRFKQEAYLPPYESRWQVFVLHDADRMLPYSSNALLKTFEEPPHHTIIILLSSAPSKFLPTVLSRCRKVFFHPLSIEEISLLLSKRGIDKEKGKAIAQRAQGSIGQALRLAEEGEDPLTEKLLAFLKLSEWPYEEIKEISTSLGTSLETYRTTVEEETTEALGGENLKDLSATQREQVEKEIQGVATMRYQNIVENLLQTLFGWYRDIELHHAKGSDVQPKFSLFKVNQIIEETRLAILRFVPVASALETLFLKLEMTAKKGT